jgi:hypothetical protein
MSDKSYDIYYSMCNEYGMREATYQESKSVYDYVNSVSTPTGISFYDIKENDHD